MPTSPILIDIPEQIDGPRVRLRPYMQGDAKQLWKAIEESREHLSPWLPWASSYHSLDQAREFVVRAHARWMLREDVVVGIFERESGCLLGGSGLHRINWDLRTFEIGYWLRQSAEGQGYMRETVKLLTQLAFNLLEAVRVEIRMDVRNTRSQSVAANLGFVHEGTIRQSVADTSGRPRDHHIYALIRDDYDRLPWNNRPD